MQKYETFSNELKKFIETEYKKTYSVTKVLLAIKDKFEMDISRKPIENYLKYLDIYEGLNGPNYLKMKVENNKKIMMKKYGVENYGQLKNSGYVILNNIEYTKISYIDEEYKLYRNAVNKETKKNIKKMDVPNYCYYTGILFADIEGKSNPNDPRKRSVDHKIPIIHCYLNGISIEKASSIDNIVFVLKYVNSIKGNTLEESFIPLAKKIRKVFINEGYKSN